MSFSCRRAGASWVGGLGNTSQSIEQWRPPHRNSATACGRRAAAALKNWGCLAAWPIRACVQQAIHRTRRWHGARADGSGDNVCFRDKSFELLYPSRSFYFLIRKGSNVSKCAQVELSTAPLTAVTSVRLGSRAGFKTSSRDDSARSKTSRATFCNAELEKVSPSSNSSLSSSESSSSSPKSVGLVSSSSVTCRLNVGCKGCSDALTAVWRGHSISSLHAGSFVRSSFALLKGAYISSGHTRPKHDIQVLRNCLST